MSSSAALSRRKGGTAQTRRIPWEYICCVMITVFLLFCILYIHALNKVVQQSSQHGSSQHLRKETPHQQQHEQQREVLELKEDMSPLFLPGQTLVLTTKLGDIKIKLREDLSKVSADYIRQIIAAGDCPRCTFYRAEEKGILQGIIKNPSIAQEDLVQVTKGDCPEDLKDSKWKDNCHGPVMDHGMVGWAAGKTGPDFFIDWYKRPAKFWGAQHTVWGKVMLEECSEVVDEIWTLPVNKKGLTYLVDQLPFTMKIV